MPTKNHGRMAQDMKREIIAIIGEMKDPRVNGGLLTVTRLDVTPDLDQAKVYISVMGREGGPAPVVKALNKAQDLGNKLAHKQPEEEPAPAPVCPFCLEEVNPGATKCCHCGSELPKSE